MSPKWNHRGTNDDPTAWLEFKNSENIGCAATEESVKSRTVLHEFLFDPQGADSGKAPFSAMKRMPAMRDASVCGHTLDQFPLWFKPPKSGSLPLMLKAVLHDISSSRGWMVANELPGWPISTETYLGLRFKTTVKGPNMRA